MRTVKGNTSRATEVSIALGSINITSNKPACSLYLKIYHACHDVKTIYCMMQININELVLIELAVEKNYHVYLEFFIYFQ